MFSASGKFLLIFLPLIFLVFTIFLATPAFAQAPPPPAPCTNPGGCPFTADSFRAPEANEYSTVNLFEFTIPCMGAGFSNIVGHDCGGYARTTGNFTAYNRLPDGGAIGGLSTIMTAMTTNPPASSTQYFAYLRENFGLIPKAHAQVSGSGSGVIQPVFALWVVIRNLAYLGFIIVFIIIGFMIMFRQRLNPQTVITFQSALPGLVIGLILVTFSYFIASLLIDLSFILFQVIAAIFLQAGGNGLTNQQIGDIAAHGNIIDLWRAFVLNGNTINTVSSPIINAIQQTQGGITPQGVILSVLSSLSGGNNILGFTISGVVVTILIIATVIQMIRLVWALLQAYISIFVNTILGPIFILYSTLPGRRGALSFWWRNIIGNAIIFPAVFAAFLFAGLIAGPLAAQAGSSFPLFAFPEGFLRAILAFGIVLGTPAIPKMVKGAIGVKDFGEYASAAIGGAAIGYAAARGGAGYSYSGAMEQLGIPGRRKAIQESDVKRQSGPYVSGSFRDFWAKHGPGK